MKYTIALLLLVLISSEAFAKKDFKGLFGSYRREKFTENEGQDSDFGFDLMLSALLPFSSVVKSTEDSSGNSASMYYATFFNLESAVFLTLNYYWEPFVSFGYYSYETRKENAVRDSSQNELPLFHQFELTSIPIIAGVKYRFSREDIVPFVGAGAGFSFVKRKAYYDYSALVDESSNTVLTLQGIIGLEFFFAPRMGLRLEAAAYYLNIPGRTFQPGPNPATLPIMYQQSNIWSLRYASGVFFLL